MAEILITGGCGFIGSHLTEKLRDMGHRPTVVDDLSTGRCIFYNVPYAFQDIRHYHFDRQFEYVFHLAALASVPASVANPKKSYRINVQGTNCVLNEAQRKGVKKVIFTSSCAVYGDAQEATEETEPNPQSPYAKHKLEAEKLMQLYSEKMGVPTVSLRLFNVYGSRFDPNSQYSLVISKFIKLSREKKPLTIYGDGKQTRDFVCVSDVVDALILAMEKPVEKEVINICTQKSTSVNDIAKLIGGKKEYLPEREGDAKHISGINTKAQELLGWQPKITIEEGIKKII